MVGARLAQSPPAHRSDASCYQILCKDPRATALSGEWLRAVHGTRSRGAPRERVQRRPLGTRRARGTTRSSSIERRRHLVCLQSFLNSVLAIK